MKGLGESLYPEYATLHLEVVKLHQSTPCATAWLWELLEPASAEVLLEPEDLRVVEYSSGHANSDIITTALCRQSLDHIALAQQIIEVKSRAL